MTQSLSSIQLTELTYALANK